MIIKKNKQDMNNSEPDNKRQNSGKATNGIKFYGNS